MRTMIGWATAVVLGLSMLGCAGTGGRAAGKCESCEYGYVPVNSKRTDYRAFCMKDGKQLDCTKNPSECPECAKHTVK